MDLRNNQEKEEQEKNTLIMELLDNDAFNKLIMEDFINKGVLEYSLTYNLENSDTLDNLKARQILHKYIFDIVTNKV